MIKVIPELSIGPAKRSNDIVVSVLVEVSSNILDIAEEARLLSMTFKGPICPCAINGKANITVVKRINDFMADCFADVA